ncbi:hypothetical protein [Marinicella rhabdoformis]|uniref:hypothetical protein n=1 Tax=Marinicella rhabdoformis TaxID=2580566 RepID=UPI0012AEBA16|nr:hypothetical protein [Marinicella rhabdoformis]
MKQLIITLDSQCFTYLALTFFNQKEPLGDLAQEKVALFRSFVYGEVELSIVPTVEEEWKQIKDIAKYKQHNDVNEILIPTLSPYYSSLSSEKISLYTEKYLQYHPKKNDCKILSEAEVLNCDFFVSYDNDLINRLSKVSETSILKPKELWKMLDVPRGAKPKVIPKGENPMVNEVWWKW